MNQHISSEEDQKDWGFLRNLNSIAYLVQQGIKVKRVII